MNVLKFLGMFYNSCTTGILEQIYPLSNSNAWFYPVLNIIWLIDII